MRAWVDRGGGDLLWGLLGPTTRFLRPGEPAPEGYREEGPLEVRARLRTAWSRVRSCVPLDAARGRVREGIVLAGPLAPGPGVLGLEGAAARERGPLWERLEGALCGS